MKLLQLIFRCLAVAGLTSVSGSALAEDYPSRNITMIVGFPAGGAVDAVGRALAQHLSTALGKPVVVENRTGAAGNIGAQAVANAAPDGHTLLMAPITSYAMIAAVDPASARYRLDKDFAPVSLVAYLPLVLMVNDGVTARTPAELVRLAKTTPAVLNFGSSGNGQIDHVAGEMFKRQAGVDMTHIPYRGAAPAMVDLIGGQLQILFATTATAVVNMKTGRVRPLMVTSPKRLDVLPDVPTAQESGFPGFEVGSVYGILAPAGTPAPILRRLNLEVQKALQTSEVRQLFKNLGIEVRGSTTEEAASRVTGEMEKWARVVRDANIKP